MRPDLSLWPMMPVEARVLEDEEEPEAPRAELPPGRPRGVELEVPVREEDEEEEPAAVAELAVMEGGPRMVELTLLLLLPPPRPRGPLLPGPALDMAEGRLVMVSVQTDIASSGWQWSASLPGSYAPCCNATQPTWWKRKGHPLWLPTSASASVPRASVPLSRRPLGVSLWNKF